MERVTGRALFGADMTRPGDLALAVARAPEGPARITRLDLSAARAMPGVVRIFTAAGVPGRNLYGVIAPTKDQPVLADGLVRCPGEAIALVAAQTKAQALAAASAVKMTLDPLPAVRDGSLALEPDAVRVHDKTNLLFETNIVRGDVEAALAESAVVVSRRYTTKMVDHAAIEPEGGRADWVDGRVVVTACTQNPHYDQADLASVLGVPEDRVRVVQAETGGAFGGKLDLSVQLYLALACYHLHRPVSMVYSREESFLATGKRHSLIIDCKTGADADGNLTGAQMDILVDTGAYASYGLAVCVRAAVHGLGPYRVRNVRVRSRAAYTHNPWCGAMRGFGVPQAALAHEGQMNALAEELGLDPIEFRIKNALTTGDTTITGQRLGGGVGLVECLEAIRPYYHRWLDRAGDDGHLSRGVGVGAMYYGIGNTAVSNPSGARVEVNSDGQLILFTGAADIGQGSDTVLTQIVAERLGWDMDRVTLVRADTDLTPNAGATSASRQTFISGNAVRAAAANLEDLLLGEGEDALEIGRHDLILEGGMVIARGAPDKGIKVTDLARAIEDRGGRAMAEGHFDPRTTGLDPETGQGSPYQTYAFAAHAALVEVDRDTGLIRVDRVAAAHDVGRAVNPKGVEGQIAGGVVMGLGYATMEEYEPGEGVNFDQYHIPTMADVPQITPILIEKGDPEGPFGAKGVGEPALIPTAPAVAAAVGAAVKRPMTDLPLNLERVMAAWRKQ